MSSGEEVQSSPDNVEEIENDGGICTFFSFGEEMLRLKLKAVRKDAGDLRELSTNINDVRFDHGTREENTILTPHAKISFDISI